MQCPGFSGEIQTCTRSSSSFRIRTLLSKPMQQHICSISAIWTTQLKPRPDSLAESHLWLDFSAMIHLKFIETLAGR